MSALKNPKKRVLVLASGRGLTFEALVKFSLSEKSQYEIAGLISDQKDSRVLDRAKALKIWQLHIPYDKAEPKKFFELALRKATDLNVDVIALAGFLLLVRDPLLSSYKDRIVNTHPSLLPKYGGKGMFGDRVHDKVLENRESKTGVTVHLVNAKLDEGDILEQKIVPVLEGDSVETLSERVRECERDFYPQTLNNFVISW